MAESVRAKYYNDLTSKMYRHRATDEFCDVHIRVGQESFKCHRLVLSSASEYFEKTFNGNFNESSSREVVLQELDASVFKIMLQFMYSGEAALSRSNLYDVFCAADFYIIPRLLELCIIYTKENLNKIADLLLKIFWYARRVGMREFAGYLKRHIYEHFGYFVNVPDFVELSVDILLEILGTEVEEDVIPAQDVFFEGVYTWITRQENLNADQKKSYFDRLLKKVDLTQLSDKYSKDRLPQRMAALQSPDGSTDGGIHAPNVVQSCPKLLRAYVSTYYARGDDSLLGTRVFTGFSSTSPSTWIYTGKVKDCFSAKHMDTTVVGDLLYSLSYSEGGPHGLPSGQTFRYSSSASMYSYTSLSLPPLVRMFDMCSEANEIYLYDKDYYSGPGLFVYKRDIDTWFPLPCAKIKVQFASLTCDDRRLYLIGGSPDNPRISNLIQAYDLRTREWSELSHTKYDYSRAACCMYGKEIFVYGHHSYHDGPSYGEIYDPRSCISRPFCDNDKLRSYNPNLVDWSGTVVCYYPYYDFTVARYSDTPDHQNWISLPSLDNAVASVKCMSADRDPRHCILNMVTF